MFITVCKGKIHRCRVTGTGTDHTGSVTIDKALMEAAQIRPYEMVHIHSVNGAGHWEAYAVPGGPGQVCLSGWAERSLQVGDEVVILSLGIFQPDEADILEPSLVFVDSDNKIVQPPAPLAFTVETVKEALRKAAPGARELGEQIRKSQQQHNCDLRLD